MTAPTPTIPEVPEPFRAGAAAVELTRDVITVSGPDAVKFLQGQLSQDVEQLDIGGSAWSFLLQPQGKVDAWMRVSRLPDADDTPVFLLDLDAGAGEAALKRLRRFMLRTDAALELATWQTVSVRGPGSAAAASDPAGVGAVLVAAADWPGVDGVDLLGPEVSVPDGLATADVDALERLRVLCGIPAMGSELTESTIPAEAGVVARSVSFTKGCFTGQELVARIDSRGGNVPKHLRVIVAADGTDLTVGGVLTIDGAEVGQLTSVASGGGDAPAVGLAYVKRSVEPPAVADVDGLAVAVAAAPS